MPHYGIFMPLNPGVLSGERVAMNAISLDGIPMVSLIVTSFHIFPVSQEAKMVRVNAGRVLALMINLLVRWDATDKIHICHAVRQINLGPIRETCVYFSVSIFVF